MVAVFTPAFVVAFSYFSYLSARDYRKAKKGFEVKIFLDENGSLHCHGAKEKFSGYSTGFDVLADGKAVVRSVQVNLWEEAYGFDGNTLLEIHYGEIPSKKGLSKIFDANMSPTLEKARNLNSPYYLKIKSIAQNWHLAIEDLGSNLNRFYPGELIKLLHDGFHSLDLFDQFILQSSENARKSQEFAEELNRMKMFSLDALERHESLASIYINERKKRRPSHFASETVNLVADIMDSIFNSLPDKLKPAHEKLFKERHNELEEVKFIAYQ